MNSGIAELSGDKECLNQKIAKFGFRP